RQWRRRRFDMPAPTYSALLTAAVFLGAVFTVPDAAAWPAALLGTALVVALATAAVQQVGAVERTGDLARRVQEKEETIGELLKDSLGDLVASEYRYRELERMSPVGIFQVDMGGQIQEVNPRFIAMTGLKARQAKHGWEQVLHADDRDPSMAKIHRAILDGKPFDVEFRIEPRLDPEKLTSGQRKPANGVDDRTDRETAEPRWVLCQGVPRMGSMGQRLGAILLLVDITDRKKLEEELEAARDAAVAANHSKSDFVAMISHQLRTQLTTVRGASEVLQESGDWATAAPERAEALRMLQRSTMFLQNVIDDLLDLARLESGTLRLQTSNVDPVKVVHHVVRLVKPQADVRGVSIDLSTVGRLPRTIEIDGDRLRQVLFNLLSNRVRFTSGQTVTLSVAWRPGGAADDEAAGDGGVSPKTGGVITFAIDDPAPGGDVNLDRLMNAIENIQDPGVANLLDRGLGLLVARRLARVMQIPLSAEAVAGGVRLTLEMPAGDAPLAEAAADADLLQSAEGVDVPPPSVGPAELSLLKGRRVLVAEDSPDVQTLIRFFLTKAELEVEIVDDGRRAVDTAVKALEDGRPFDVVLMDMNMPVLDGYAAVGELRVRGYEGPVVALTARAVALERDRCLEA
ncbi:MAG: PAS domain-containing hybrid sensor histidine kinase/response regulator, partial [Planctomycetia bacterium]